MIKKLLKTFMGNWILGTIVVCIIATIYFLIFPKEYYEGEFFPSVIIFLAVMVSFCFSVSLFLYSLFQKEINNLLKDKILFFILIIFLSFFDRIATFQWYLPNDFLPGDLEILGILFNIILFYTIALFLYFNVLGFLKRSLRKKKKSKKSK